jgi:hypothetical protein
MLVCAAVEVAVSDPVQAFAAFGIRLILDLEQGLT